MSNGGVLDTSHTAGPKLVDNVVTNVHCLPLAVEAGNHVHHLMHASEQLLNAGVSSGHNASSRNNSKDIQLQRRGEALTPNLTQDDPISSYEPHQGELHDDHRRDKS